MMGVEARSMASAGGESRACLAVGGPALAAAVLSPPSAVAFLPVSVPGTEAMLAAPAFPVLEAPPASAAGL